jgi:hypothetical protein
MINFLNKNRQSKNIIRINQQIQKLKKIYNNNNNNIPNNKWIILLTTAVANVTNTIVDTQYRINLYTSKILEWLEKTKYIIVVVESSGYSFPDIAHERLYKVSFRFETPLKNSSQYEANSILYALNEIKDTSYYNDCSHILKVTGRYFLDGIEEHLNSKPQGKDLYLQKHRNNEIKWQNTEYFGIRKNLMYDFLITIKDDNLIEHKLWDFSINKSGCHIGYFNNNVRRGGDNLLIENL